MMKLFFPFFIFLLALFGAVQTPFAADRSLTRDCPPYFPAVKSPLNLFHVAELLEDAGISFPADSSGDGFCHMKMAVGSPMRPNINITVSDDQSVGLGLSFR
ncbi:MAG: hypothetical protein Q7S00_08260 [bacterium]|nr:hypothetical protein [bacterium]